MKSIIKIALAVIVIAVCVKVFTGKSVGTHYIDNIDEKIELNEKSNVGDVIECPICGKEFKKQLFGSAFCSNECEEKYEKRTNAAEKEQKVTEGTISIFNDTKESIKKNFGK